MGTGKYSRFFSDLSNELLEKIVFFVDNDKQKQGGTIKVRQYEYTIYGMGEILKFPLQDVLLIVGIMNYNSVMKSVPAPFNSLSYIGLKQYVDLVLDQKACNIVVPDVISTKQFMIPKKIHYCWFGKNDMPDSHKRYVEGWGRCCPDYEIILWNEKNYDYTKNRYMLQAYEAKKWGFVPDYARLDIIYKEGGIYLDTDVEMLSSYDDLLQNKAFVGLEDFGRVNLGQGFGACAGNLIIKEMMDEYDSLEFVKRDGSLNLIASPRYQTEILKKHGLNLSGEYQDLDQIVVYPEKVFCPLSMRTHCLTSNRYTKSIHHFAGSWLDDETQKIKCLN